MMSFAARQTFQTVKPHIPLIRFRKGGLDKTAGVSGLNSPSSSSAPSKNTIDESQLPLKYQRKPLGSLEIEIIQRGGPDL